MVRASSPCVQQDDGLVLLPERLSQNRQQPRQPLSRVFPRKVAKGLLRFVDQDHVGIAQCLLEFRTVRPAVDHHAGQPINTARGLERAPPVRVRAGAQSPRDACLQRLAIGHDHRPAAPRLGERLRPNDLGFAGAVARLYRHDRAGLDLDILQTLDPLHLIVRRPQAMVSVIRLPVFIPVALHHLPGGSVRLDARPRLGVRQQTLGRHRPKPRQHQPNRVVNPLNRRKPRHTGLSERGVPRILQGSVHARSRALRRSESVSLVHRALV
jgi:hypothetical protein